MWACGSLVKWTAFFIMSERREIRTVRNSVYQLSVKLLSRRGTVAAAAERPLRATRAKQSDVSLGAECAVEREAARLEVLDQRGGVDRLIGVTAEPIVDIPHKGHAAPRDVDSDVAHRVAALQEMNEQQRGGERIWDLCDADRPEILCAEDVAA